VKSRALPIASVVLPLVVTAIAFRWSPRSELIGVPVIGSALLGWLALGFTPMARRWLKVLLMIAYVPAMWLAITVVMIAVYGVPGL
jgi:multisubunit Na+/H+ antiporter MnhE subunit